MKEAGLEITHPDPAPFVKGAQPVHDHFSAMIGADLIKRVKEAQQ
jgi:TRAP-type C4-dicarboxylate transport system substrate-binding protein